jgi:hypothetical protein
MRTYSRNSNLPPLQLRSFRFIGSAKAANSCGLLVLRSQAEHLSVLHAAVSLHSTIASTFDPQLAQPLPHSTEDWRKVCDQLRGATLAETDRWIRAQGALRYAGELLGT